jgi:diguanylate cyclase (GGDEF)-like protein/PAS domain S-box-containing protein
MKPRATSDEELDVSCREGGASHLPDSVNAAEAARIAALKGLMILDTAAGQGFDRICEMASDLLQAPISLVSFIDEDRQWLKARVGFHQSETPRSHSFCSHAIRSDDVFKVDDATLDFRFRESPLVIGGPGIRSYAGAPLVVAPGIRVGTLCVMDTRPRIFDSVECELLAELSKVVVSEIALHQATREALATQTALFTTEQRYRALLEASSAMVWRAEADGRILDISLSGPFADLSPSDFLGLSWFEMIHPEDRRPILKRAVEAQGLARAYDGAHRVRTAAGGYRWTRMRVVPLLDKAGRVSEWVGKCIDEHDRYLAEEGLRKSEERLRLALRAGRMVAWEYDPVTRKASRSGDAEEMLGVDPGETDGFLAHVHPDDRHLLAEAYRFGGSLEVEEMRYVHPDGRLMWLSSRGAEIVDGSGERRIIGVTFDISQRKATDERAWRAAHHDGLTGLPNRAFFQSHLEATLGAGGCNAARMALILIDIDDFKGINDAIGHEAGDEILRQAAERLRHMVGSRGLIARLGSDEFGILLAACPDEASALELTERLLEDLAQAIYRSNQIVTCRASAGVALYPEHHSLPGELMKDAEIALHAAKTEGRNRALIYDPLMRDVVEVRVQIASQMRAALAADEIVPYYQPKIDLRTGAIIGFEALARWLHPERGLLTPGVFASAFDSPELALGIGRKIVAGVLRDLQGWLAKGLQPGSIAVNLAAADFSETGLAPSILGRLKEAGIPRRHFSVEVTEGVFLGKGGGEVAAILQSLHDGGIRIALDDFGTGFASLTHLKQFPVDEIKIDQSFVRDVDRDADNAAIVTAVIGLGRSLDLCIVAEGVETLAEARFLREQGCQHAQGFLFSKPMMASRVEHFLRAHTTTEAPLRKAEVA